MKIIILLSVLSSSLVSITSFAENQNDPPKITFNCKVTQSNQEKKCNITLTIENLISSSTANNNLLSTSQLCDLAPYSIQYKFNGNNDGGIFKYSILQEKKKMFGGIKLKEIHQSGASLYKGVSSTEQYSNNTNGNGISCLMNVK